MSTWHPQVLQVLIVQQSRWHFTSSSDLPLRLWQAMAVGSRKQVQVSTHPASGRITNINYSTESQAIHQWQAQTQRQRPTRREQLGQRERLGQRHRHSLRQRPPYVSIASPPLLVASLIIFEAGIAARTRNYGMRKPWLGVGDAVWVAQDFDILRLSWDPRIMYIVSYKGIACKTEFPHYENILWC